tara:strand:+ start:1900 stop:2304 length:405 start_codon:yes stop_codon:yes gene_type:complete
MSKDWVKDINDMHRKFGVHEALADFDKLKLKEYLEFRLRFLDEELNETKSAALLRDPEEVVDGLIDLCVVAIGTMDAFGIDAYKAWDAVHKANMAKEVGINTSRKNDFNLPDLVKPEEWENPSHEGNHGTLTDM